MHIRNTINKITHKKSNNIIILILCVLFLTGCQEERQAVNIYTDTGSMVVESSMTEMKEEERQGISEEELLDKENISGEEDSGEKIDLQKENSKENSTYRRENTKEEPTSQGENTKEEPTTQSNNTKEESTASEENPKEDINSNMPKVPIAGKKSLGNLLITAKQPLGSTMYVWGGGWNEEDTGAGEEATTIGISPRWAEFAKEQDTTYDYDKTRYRIHDGLDCSGYVGWVVYNVFETENDNEGYVMKSATMAEQFAEYGWGEYVSAEQVSDWKAGDIMSMKGHVWISLGMCGDGSVVLLHASPPGVILCGTTLSDGSKSQAILLAEEYMSRFYPEWYEKYPDCSRSRSYLEKSGRMRWSREVLSDEEGIVEKSAEEVLKWMFDN